MATKKVNIDIIAKDKSKQALKKVRGNLDGVKKSVFNLRNAFIGLGAGLVIRSIVNTGKEIENLQVRLKFLFGTAEEGAKAFDNMAKFASKVPFSLAEIQQGAGVLAVVSDDADELAKVMELTGNVAAVTGLDFKTTAEQIQRSLSAGISAADLFRDRGVKAMLGFKAGATVSVEETAEAFDRVFGPDGKFGGATDELAKTFSGTMSMLGDKVFRFKQVLLDEGFFKNLKETFADLNSFIQENQETFDDLARFLGTTLSLALKGVVLLVKGVVSAFTGMKVILQEITDFVGITNEEFRNMMLQARQTSEAYGQMRDSILEVTVIVGTQNKKLKEQNKILKDNFDLFSQKHTMSKAYQEFQEKSLRKETQAEKDLLEQKRASSKEAISIFKTEQEMRLALNEHMKTSTMSTMQILSGLNKKAFEAYKAMQIARTIIDTYSAAVAAFAKFGGWPFGAMAAAASIAQGMAMVAMIKSQNYSGRQQGGMVKAGQPYIVGEAGKELFVPNQSGNIVPNDQLGGSVNVNFNINTVDARGFNELLTNSRATIVGMINSAVNETGRQAII